MTPEELQDIRWFKSNPLPLDFAADRIDRENGVLYDVVMAEEGEAKGHGLHLEAEFIADLVSYDAKYYSKRGLKNRFGHPGASEDTLGTQMGYFTNFRTRKKGSKMQAIADLQLLSAADISPTKPNMREWMIQMSEEAPDFVMMSIVFKPGRYYQKQKDGKKKYIWEYVPTKDDDGNTYDRWVSSDSALGKVFVEFGSKGEHYYTDTVEAGAATDNLFSTEANPHLFVSKALSWLDEHPELKNFARQHPDKVQEFLQSLGINQNPKKPLKMSILELIFGKEKATEEVALSAEQIQELRDNMTKVETTLAAAQKALSDLQAEADKQKAEFAAKETELATAQARIAELEALAADVHTKGARENKEEKEEKTPAYLSDPATERARRSFEAMQKNKKVAA